MSTCIPAPKQIFKIRVAWKFQQQVQSLSLEILNNRISVKSKHKNLRVFEALFETDLTGLRTPDSNSILG